MLIMNEIGISNPENFSCFELVEWEYMVINLNMKQKNKRNSNITKFNFDLIFRYLSTILIRLCKVSLILIF